MMADTMGSFQSISARTQPFSAARGGRSFLVTCSQTGRMSNLNLSNFARVHRYDWRANTVHSQGSCPPSSESMTHGAVYDLSPSIRFVFHVHSPTIWRSRAQLRLPETSLTSIMGRRKWRLPSQRWPEIRPYGNGRHSLWRGISMVS